VNDKIVLRALGAPKTAISPPTGMAVRGFQCSNIKAVGGCAFRSLPGPVIWPNGYCGQSGGELSLAHGIPHAFRIRGTAARRRWQLPNGADIDIMAIRMPGRIYVGDPHEDCHLLLIDDPALLSEDQTIDVIIGEVKQGQAELNPGIKDHVVLHSTLRRVEWAYEERLETVVDGLQHKLIHYSPGRGDGRVGTRLVAFGRSEHNDLHTISHTHIVRTMLRFFQENEDAFRPVQFKEPAPAFLRLLLKAGFDITK
jgi:hypothetical protein